MKLEHSLTPYTKINSKWIKDVNERPDTIKLLEENIGGTLFDINCIKIFFDPPPRIMRIKTKIKKWDLIKLKKLCTAKESINNAKRQPSEWKNIFVNKATDKGLISKYTNSSCSSISKKKPNQKMGGRGLPWWRSGWESACQCRGRGFEPWSGRIPHAAEQLGP